VAAGAVDLGPRRAVHVLPALASRESDAIDLRPLFDALRPEVVHVHTVVNPLALQAAAAFGRAVITVQDHRYFCPGRGKWTLAGHVCTEAMSPATCAPCFEDPGYGAGIVTLTAARLDALRRFTSVTVLSHYMRGELLAAGLQPDRVHVIRPLVPALPAAVAAGPACVTFVGRLTEGKGVKDAVLAWRTSGVPLPLVMAGTGPLRAWAEAEGATVLGWLSRPALAGVYARSAALLLPSRWQEPYGIAGVEAASMGVPVVAWRSGGIAEWHAGDDLLVGWGDVDGLAAALARAIGRRVPSAPLPEPGPLLDELDAVYATLP
jgi:glycosyltransferase involved in cell wall biosynthesis